MLQLGVCKTRNRPGKPPEHPRNPLRPEPTCPRTPRNTPLTGRTPSGTPLMTKVRQKNYNIQKKQKNIKNHQRINIICNWKTEIGSDWRIHAKGGGGGWGWGFNDFWRNQNQSQMHQHPWEKNSYQLLLVHVFPSLFPYFFAPCFL